MPVKVINTLEEFKEIVRFSDIYLLRFRTAKKIVHLFRSIRANLL